MEGEKQGLSKGAAQSSVGVARARVGCREMGGGPELAWPLNGCVCLGWEC